MGLYNVMIDSVGIDDGKPQIAIAPSAQSAGAASMRHYPDADSFRADLREYFGFADRAVERLTNGENHHEVLLNFQLTDDDARYFKYPLPKQTKNS